MLAIGILCFYLWVGETAAQANMSVIGGNGQITQYARYVAATPTVAKFFNNPWLGVFIPSDAAMNASGFSAMADKDRVVKGHMFQSVADQKNVMGTTGNWTGYIKVTARNNVFFYYRPSIEGGNRLFMSLATAQGPYYVNDATVTTPNIANGSQAYHIIDRVLTIQSLSFLKYLEANATLKRSLAFWNSLQEAANTGTIPQGIHYKVDYLEFNADFPCTMLVPTDAAWSVLNQAEMNNLTTNLSVLMPVMARYYIPDNLYFLRGQDVSFKAGFNEQPKVNDLNLFDGFITKDMQGDTYVSVQGFTAKIIQANIPTEFGVIHIIDNPLAKKMTVGEYLTANNMGFMKQLNALNLSQFLNESYTIMAPDDASVARQSPDTLRQALLNSFIVGNVRLTPSMGPVTTLGGLKVRMRTADGNNYIDVLNVTDGNLYIRSVLLGPLNQLVGPLSVSQINGLISNEPMTCDEMLTVLNCSLYQSLVKSNVITLNRGSPYMMMVPVNEALTNYIVQQNTTAITSPAMKYVLQRMIIPSPLVLAKRSSGTFKAATMNYAAMQEMITMTISDTNCTISLYGVQQTFNFSAGGFYCYANSRDDQSRYNIIYPVGFVLATPPGVNVNICVNPPCLACHNALSYLILVAATLLVTLWNGHQCFL